MKRHPISIPFEFSLFDLDEARRLHRTATGFTHAIQILDEGRDMEVWPKLAPRALRMNFEDIGSEVNAGAVLGDDGGPTPTHVRNIILFSQSLGASDLLAVHCKAGVSRSPAALLIALAANTQPGEEQAVYEQVLGAYPHVIPNLRMMRMADSILGRGGLLASPAAEIRRAYDASIQRND